MKVCLDRNILVSAFATRGLAADVLRVVLAEHELVVPTVVLREMERILRDKIGIPTNALAIARQVLESQTTVDTPDAPLGIAIREPDDAWVRVSAATDGAELLITGDADLLAVASQSPIPVLPPRAFWERLHAT